MIKTSQSAREKLDSYCKKSDLQAIDLYDYTCKQFAAQVIIKKFMKRIFC